MNLKDNFVEIIGSIFGVLVVIASLILQLGGDDNQLLATSLTFIGTVMTSVAATYSAAHKAAITKQNSELSIIHGHLVESIQQINSACSDNSEYELNEDKLMAIYAVLGTLKASSNDLGTLCGKNKEIAASAYRNSRELFEELNRSTINKNMEEMTESVQEAVQQIQEVKQIQNPISPERANEMFQPILEKLELMQRNIDSTKIAGEQISIGPSHVNNKYRNNSYSKNATVPLQLSNIELYMARLRRLNMDHVGSSLQKVIVHLAHEILVKYGEPLTKKEIIDMIMANDEIKNLVINKKLSKTKIAAVLSVFSRTGVFNVSNNEDGLPSKWSLKKAFHEFENFAQVHDCVIYYMDIDDRLSDSELENLYIRNDANSGSLNKKLYDYVAQQLSRAP